MTANEFVDQFQKPTPTDLALRHSEEARVALAAKVRALADELKHWKRVAMLSSGFAPDVCDAIVADPPPMTESEMARALAAADEWAAKRNRESA